MNQRLSRPPRSAARARSTTWPGVPSPSSTAPRLGPEPKPIALLEHGQGGHEVAPGGGHLGQPGAARPVVLEPARGEHDDDTLIGAQGWRPAPLHPPRPPPPPPPPPPDPLPPPPRP